MTPRDIDLADQPITTKNYTIYNKTDLPKLFLGFSLKSKFDEKRLNIKSKYTPKKISHFKWTSELEPMFVYGVEVTPRLRYSSLLDSLQSHGRNLSTVSFDKHVERYKKLLNEYCLTCDDCYRYLNDGIYPIDIHHLDDISKKSFTKEINSGFKSMLEDTDPWYFSIPNFKLFILTWSAGYGVDTKINK